MGHGSEKINLSRSKSWDTFQNDQQNLLWMDIAFSEQEIADIVKLDSENMFKLTELPLLFTKN